MIPKARRKKPEKTERKKLVEKADKAFGEYIKIRDGWTCFVCGKTRQQATIQPGHLITRGKYSVRWDERNAQAVCKGCNILHEFQPEHHTQKFLKKFGQAAYDRLVFESNQSEKLSNSDLKGVIEYYKQKKEELLSNV